ncbi:MAG TPA: hypothetical protein VM286_07685 [Candidatus Thermoplasmatota archaeon]|nr:hypothetical protein [Candidatus Thermoplasmatota archaeon]
MDAMRRPPRPRPLAGARCHGHAPRSLAPWLGASALLAWAIGLCVLAVLAPMQAAAVLAASLLAPLMGKETAAIAGLLLGAPPAWTATALVAVDGAAVLLLARLLAGRHPPPLVAAEARRRNGARRVLSLGELYGRALAPLAFLGPFVAVLMGESAGLPPRRLLAVVLAASATTAAAWALALGWLEAAGAGASVVVLLATAVPMAILGAARSVLGLRRAHGRAERVRVAVQA